jgi:hypothetical protein
MQEDNIMHTLTKTVVALGFVGAMAIGSTAPVGAQGLNVGPGLNIQIGPSERNDRPDRDYQPDRRGARDGRYYDYYPGRSEGNACPPHYTIQSGVCKPYRGY